MALQGSIIPLCSKDVLSCQYPSFLYFQEYYKCPVSTRFNIPGILGFPGPYFLQALCSPMTCITKAYIFRIPCFQSPIFPGLIVWSHIPRVLNSHSAIFPGLCILTTLYYHGLIFPGPYIPRVLHVLYVPTVLYSQNSVFPELYFP